MKWSFQMQTISPLCPVLCHAALPAGTPNSVCLSNLPSPGPTVDRLLSLQQTATAAIFTACIPPSLGERANSFYNSMHLHVQLLGGFGAECPIRGLILLLSNQGPNFTWLWQWQNHCIKLKYQELFLSCLWNFSLYGCHRIFSRHWTITTDLWLGFWINNSL